MEINELHALARSGSGKGQARRLRQAGFIPAVFYGPGTKAILLSVSAAELLHLRKKEEQAFIKLIIEDQGEKTERLSVLKELQLEPLSRRYLHADFYEISMDQKFTFDVPIHFSGHPQGVDDGGELHLLKRELKVSGFPGRLPESLSVDIGGLKIGDTLRVQDLSPIEDVKVLDHDETLIAAVSAAKGAGEPAEEAESGTAP